MRFITFIFTAICFLAFAEVQAAVGNEPAFPTWVESGFDDPPDYNLEAIYIVIEAPEQILFIRQQPPAFFRLAATQTSTQPKPFVYTPYVSAGGVGRLYGSNGFLNNLATRLILSSTSGGLSRIRN